MVFRAVAGTRWGTGIVDVATLQTLARSDDVAAWTSEYGLVVVDECHHVPAAAFEQACDRYRLAAGSG